MWHYLDCKFFQIYCSGWVVEPCRIQGRLRTEITYILQVLADWVLLCDYMCFELLLLGNFARVQELAAPLRSVVHDCFPKGTDVFLH